MDDILGWFGKIIGVPLHVFTTIVIQSTHTERMGEKLYPRYTQLESQLEYCLLFLDARLFVFFDFLLNNLVFSKEKRSTLFQIMRARRFPLVFVRTLDRSDIILSKFDRPELVYSVELRMRLYIGSPLTTPLPALQCFITHSLSLGFSSPLPLSLLDLIEPLVFLLFFFRFFFNRSPVRS